MQKDVAKVVMKAEGVPVPEGKVVSRQEAAAGHPLPRPYVLKPVNEGSSVGVAIVTANGNYGDPIGRDVEGPWLHFERLLAEPFIRGRELTVAVLGDQALAVTELQPKSGFYDYDAKYTDGMTEHVCPARIPDEIAEAAKAMALKAHQLLGCRGCSRSDFRWDDEQGEAGLYLLEVNTQPGMTPLSLVPEQARYRGMSYAELVEKIVEEALGTVLRPGGRTL
jgi:D-alanine-D-alanine ligase